MTKETSSTTKQTAPKKAKTTKVVVETVVVKPVQATPTVAPVTIVTPAASAAAASEETVSAIEMQECLTSLTELRNQTNVVVAKVKALNRRVEREMKAAAKAGAKKKQKTAARTPSGFTKPANIVPELASFLGVAPGTMVSRTDVTRAINAYIKENGLQNPDNRRHILCDSKLTSLLNPGAELTYFNMQRYLKPLFVTTTPP
jgi:upstream activation factor subunit UAF30